MVELLRQSVSELNNPIHSFHRDDHAAGISDRQAIDGLNDLSLLYSKLLPQIELSRTIGGGVSCNAKPDALRCVETAALTHQEARFPRKERLPR